MKQRVIDLNLPDKESSKDIEFKQLRLQVFLAHAGVASRRNSEVLISSGRVRVNGEKITSMGFLVSPNDAIFVDDKQVFLETTKQYVLLNKPPGYVCSSDDEKGRGTAKDLLSAQYSERLYNIGRLDMFSAGAILFTNDGDFAYKVGHPSAEIEKEYIIESTFPYNEDVLIAFKKGLRISGVYYKALEAERLTQKKMRIVLVEGKNREIRRVLDFFNIRIKTLVRIRIGNIKLGSLQYGEFRELSVNEKETLLALVKNRPLKNEVFSGAQK